jgi:uncharacterized protein with HEPN domain
LRRLHIKDKKTANAVVRSFEIIGEAAKKIPEPLKEANSDVPWHEIIGMRNKISHEYFGIDLEKSSGNQPKRTCSRLNLP